MHDDVASSEGRRGREGRRVGGLRLRMRRPDCGTDRRDRRHEARVPFGDGGGPLFAGRCPHRVHLVRSDAESLAIAGRDEFVNDRYGVVVGMRIPVPVAALGGHHYDSESARSCTLGHRLYPDSSHDVRTQTQEQHRDN